MTIFDFENKEGRLWLPFMASFYNRLAQPMAWLGFRVLVGGALVYEGWPKIIDPLGQAGFVEALGFYPGWLWSIFLSVMQFFGGLAIMLGLFTRPAALTNAVMLAVTFWFHHTHPFGTAFLTPEGLALLKSAGAENFTPAGLRRLADGGHVFLELVQGKAEMLSLIWTAAAAFFAAFGGGPLSVDRQLMRKEF